MRSMVEGGFRKRVAMRRTPSVSASHCHLPVPGRIGKPLLDSLTHLT
jgi:hypothetical protein